MKKQKHVHKYTRDKIGNKKQYVIFRCLGLDNCPQPNHYVPIDLIVGKQTICHGCNEVVIITKEMSTKKKPKCLSCRKGLKEDSKLFNDEIVNDMMNILGDD